MSDPATMIRESATAKGLGVRPLADLVGVSFKTMHRYSTGTSRVPEKYERQIAESLWKRASERLAFIQACKRSRAEKKTISNAEMERKKAKTAVTRSHHCKISLQPYFKASDEAEMEMAKPENKSQYGQFVWQMDLHLRYRGMSSWAEIFETKTDAKILTINANEGLVFYPGEMRGNRIVQLWGREAMSAYYRYCREKNINHYGLIELAREAVDKSSLLDPYSYQDESVVIVGREMLRIWQREIGNAADVWSGKVLSKEKAAEKNMGKHYLINQLRGFTAEITQLQTQGTKVIELRQKLLNAIESISKKLP